MLVADPTTCAFVTMSPVESKTTPDPSPELVRISTTDGSTSLIAAENAACSAAYPAGGAVAAADGWGPAELAQPAAVTVASAAAAARRASAPVPSQPRRRSRPARAGRAGRA